MFKWLLIILLVIIAALGGTLVWLYARSAAPPAVAKTSPQEMGEGPNVTVYVHQSAVNNLLQAIFPIEGAGEVMHKPISLPYSWKVENPHVEMTADGPIFTADAQVHILGKTHVVQARGKGAIRYDSLAKELYMDLHQLEAHTDAKVLGIPLDRLNLAPSDMNVRLLSHLPLFTHFSVKKPLDVREDVEFSIISHRVRFEKQQAVVDFAVRFHELSQGAGDPAKQGQSK
ncbi:MAG TPA: hypothetical protein VGL38_00830 [bacterium]|jgi:hypothetical protein